MLGGKIKTVFLWLLPATFIIFLFADFTVSNQFSWLAVFQRKKSLTNITTRICNRNTKPILNISALPVPEAFSSSQFYGDRSLLEYQWYFKPNVSTISPLNHQFLQKPSASCAHSCSLVILVMSLHHMTSQRQAIRDTWGSVFNLKSLRGSSDYFPIEVFFVLGVSKNEILNAAVAMEAEAKNDMIVAEFDDSYFNLTRKVLMAFKWVKQFCPTAKYVMKVDEDTYINIPKFVALIQSREWNNTLFGPYFFVDPVQRTGKYATSKTAFPAPKFPPHVKGNAYFMPVDVAMKILTVSEHMPYVNMEDAAITGILAKIFNFRHFGLAKDQYYIYKAASTCELVTGSIIISQQIFSDTFYKIWERAKNNSLCKTVE